MNPSERDRAMAERRKAIMEADFNPGYTPEGTPPGDVRMVNAVEYLAYQAGQMNRNLARIANLLEKQDK